MRNLLICLIFVGCTAEQDLIEIREGKKECLDFKKSYDSIGVKTPTEKIKAKVEYCKSLGVWE